MIVKKINKNTSIAILNNPTEVMHKKYDNINLITDSSYAGNLSQISNDDWAFGEDISGKETWEMLMKGRLSEKIQKKYDEIKSVFKRETPIPSVKRRRNKNEYDGEICIDSYLANDPSYYRKVKRVSSKTRSIRVLVNVGYNCSNSAETLFKNVKHAINRVENLIKNGYLVEVYAVSCSTNLGTDQFKNLFTLIKIKESDKPIDFYRLQTAVLPGFFRSALFRAKNVINDLYQAEMDSGLGEPINTQQHVDLLKSTLDQLENQFGSKFIYFDGSTEEGKKGIESNSVPSLKEKKRCGCC